MNGKTLGHYRVDEQLGRGGMGEVYVADDLNLNRKVALKFLPDAFTGDPERMARFEREAKVLASLNHSNIAAIYGLEQAEGKRFIVMELVEGETLDGKMMAVDIKAEPEIESGVPRMLFDTELNVDQFYTQYALTPDGRRFLLLKPLTEAVSTPITIVFNWTSLLKK